MASGTSKGKIKVAWLSSFDVAYIKGNDVPIISGSYPFVLAPWIGLSLDEFKKRTDVEIHVISEQPKIINDVYFIEEGIHYHLVSNRVPFTKKAYPLFFKRITGYYLLRYKVRRIIDTIDPDVVHMHGSDIDLAMCVLSLNLPVLLTPSTFMTHLAEYNDNRLNRYKAKREQKILSRVNYFGIRAHFMKGVVGMINRNAEFYWHNYPIQKSTIKSNLTMQIFDIVFASRLNPNKGINDLLMALEILKKERCRCFTLKIVGHASDAERRHVLDFIRKLDLVEQVCYVGPTKTQRELFEHMAQAKINVLPTYFDMIPGTILESMDIGVPVIAYAVGGIPDLNLGEEKVVLVNRGNVRQLALEIETLIDSPEKRMNLANLSMIYMNKEMNNAKAIDDMISTYRSIINK